MEKRALPAGATNRGSLLALSCLASTAVAAAAERKESVSNKDVEGLHCNVERESVWL